MNSTYLEGDSFQSVNNGGGENVHKFYAMTDEEHEAAGHIKDSTNSWFDPNNYIDSLFMDY